MGKLKKLPSTTLENKISQTYPNNQFKAIPTHPAYKELAGISFTELVYDQTNLV